MCIVRLLKEKAYLVLLLLFPLEVMAQEVADGGFYAGVNSTGLITPLNEYNKRWGGQCGIMGKVGNKWVQCEMALEYSFRSFKYDQRVTVGSSDDVSKEDRWISSIISDSHHITIPIALAVGYWPMTDDNDYEGAGITFSGGYYIDYGIAGTTRAKTSYVYVESHSIQFDRTLDQVKTNLYGSKNHQLHRFDHGWTVGVMFGGDKNFRIGASYRRGLANLSNMKGYKMYNKSLFINLWIAFGND